MYMLAPCVRAIPGTSPVELTLCWFLLCFLNSVSLGEVRSPRLHLLPLVRWSLSRKASLLFLWSLSMEEHTPVLFVENALAAIPTGWWPVVMLL